MPNIPTNSCSNFKEFTLYLSETDCNKGIIYLSTGAGEFTAKIDLTGGINWNFSKKNMYKPVIQFQAIVFMHDQLLSAFENNSGKYFGGLSSAIDQVKAKITRIYKKMESGEKTKEIQLEKVYIEDIQAKYLEIVQEMIMRNGASCKYIKPPESINQKGRLEYIGGIYDQQLGLYRVVSLMDHYYNFDGFDVKN